MLTTGQMRVTVDRLTYKPGWNLTVYDGAWEGPHLQVTADVEDAYHPGQTTTLDVHTSIPPMRTVEDLYVWLQWRLNRLETHEAREWLRCGGKPLFDPHTDEGNRDVL